MHANPAATETLTGEQREPVHGHGGPGSVTLIREPEELTGGLTQRPALGAAAGAGEGAPGQHPAPPDPSYLAGYYLGLSASPP